MRDEDRVSAIEALLDYRFSDERLLLRALTHRSFVNEHPEQAADGHNERLEFLGDAVLSLVASERLVCEDAQADEGALSRRRAAYVSEAALFEAGSGAGLGRLIRMGRGQMKGGGAELPSLVADTMEALIAAVYLDGGLDAARRAVTRLLGALPAEAEDEAPDPKTVLQERIQRLYGQSPTYTVQRAGGPDHAPSFEAVAFVGGRRLGSGTGANKKIATREAARAALVGIAGLDDEALRARLEALEPG